jgi:hypothetical protein
VGGLLQLMIIGFFCAPARDEHSVPPRFEFGLPDDFPQPAFYLVPGDRVPQPLAHHKTKTVLA